MHHANTARMIQQNGRCLADDSPVSDYQRRAEKHESSNYGALNHRTEPASTSPAPVGKAAPIVSLIQTAREPEVAQQMHECHPGPALYREQPQAS